MLNPAVAWEFMKETSLVIAPRTSCDSFLMPTLGQMMHFSENVKFL